MDSTTAPTSKMKHKYLGTPSSFKYFFKNGKEAAFINGQYLTDMEYEIAELDAEVALNHPHIKIDSAQRIVDVSQTDPMARLRDQIIKDYLAQQTAATLKTNDRGSTFEGRAGIKVGGIANSDTILEAAANSNAGTPAFVAAPAKK